MTSLAQKGVRRIKERHSNLDYVIAIDFDGTLCTENFPNIGEPKWDTIVAALMEQGKGSKLILWTCRTGALLDEAVKWCARIGLKFDAVNENLPERIEYYGSDCRKIGANEYWDDRARQIK